MENNAFTVSSLNAYIKDRFDADAVLLSVFVKGEISNYKYHSSGHHYFSIKDSESSIRCVLFKNYSYGLRFKPENGMKVVLYGKVSIYTRDGTCQLYCQKIIPDGAGELQIAFEQLKNRLNEEGLFDTGHKKPIPKYPERIAVVTSPTGAAVHDIINILKNRWPLSEVLIVPVTVQGLDAPNDIASAINYVNSYSLADLIITGRGGGCIEDLWAFNTETVCRAIYNSDIPVISAVGHEPDFTISDFVADLRAATPSNAAELAVPDIKEMKVRLRAQKSRLGTEIDKIISDCRRDTAELSKYRGFYDTSTVFQDYRLDLDHMLDGLIKQVSDRINFGINRISSAGDRMKALNPIGVLSRGYSVTLKDGKAVTSSSLLHENDTVRLRFCEGGADCVVKRVYNPES